MSHAIIPPSPAIAYLRVSKEEQARQDKTSLDHQRQEIQRLSERLQVSIDPAGIFTDPGVSGGTAEARPAFMALVEYCRVHPQTRRRPGTVLVYNDSRWGRFTNAEEATYWRVELVKRYGWVVRFAQNDETEDAASRNVMRAIHSSQATLYRDQIRANAKQGARGTAAKGYWQVEAPIGYRREATAADGRTRILELGQRKADDERVRLGVGPADEVALVQGMFREYLEAGSSLGSIVRTNLDRWASRRWSRRTVGAILQNPAYVGDVVWMRRPHDKEERKETPVRPVDQWVTCADAHPPLVSRDLFAQVQAKIQRNSHQVRSPSSEYILSGLLTCAHCGQPYLGKGGPKGPPDDLNRYRFYCDRGSDRRYADCPGATGTLQKRYIEPRVIAAVAQMVRRPGVKAKVAQVFDQMMDHGQSAVRSTAGTIEQERTRLTRERDRLVGAVARGLLQDDEASPRLLALRAQLEQLSQERHQARFASHRAGGLLELREKALAMMDDFTTLAARLRGPALKELLSYWVHAAVVDKVQRTVTLTLRYVPALSLVGGLATALGRTEQPTKATHLTTVIPLPAAITRTRRAS